jgi:acid phosphatase family membrane protein YuiD
MNNDILGNAPLWSAFLAFFGAQFLKPFITLALERSWNPHAASPPAECFQPYGGSGALIVSIGMTIGCVRWNSPSPAVSAPSRSMMPWNPPAAGKQAEVINEWSSILSDIHKDGGSPRSI